MRPYIRNHFSRRAVEVEYTKHHLHPEVTQRLLQIQIPVSNTLLGVYASKWAKLTTDIPFEMLIEVIKGNTQSRYWRAIFINGKWIYNGYLDYAEVKTIEANIAKNQWTYVPLKWTIPPWVSVLDFRTWGQGH